MFKRSLLIFFIVGQCSKKAFGECYLECYKCDGVEACNQDFSKMDEEICNKHDIENPLSQREKSCLTTMDTEKGEVMERRCSSRYYVIDGERPSSACYRIYRLSPTGNETISDDFCICTADKCNTIRNITETVSYFLYPNYALEGNVFIVYAVLIAFILMFLCYLSSNRTRIIL